MKQYISKDALVAEIEKSKAEALQKKSQCKRHGLEKIMHQISAYNKVLSFIDTLEVKEVGISIPNIDDTLKEEGLDPDSKEAKVFKESYYMALENLKRGKEKSYE